MHRRRSARSVVCGLRLTVGVCALTLTLATAACSGEQPSPPEEPPPLPREGAWFREIGVAAGLTHERPEIEYARLEGRMGGGVCALDVNEDGELDLFFPGITANGGAGSRLYVATGPMRYEDRATELGVADTGSSSGCLAVDLDGDGDSDLITTGLGGARLYRNDGGKFSEGSLSVSFPPDLVTSAAVAFDADGDGDLDLAITAYGRFEPPADESKCLGPCASYIGEYAYGSTTLLFQQDDGSFVDESARLGKHPEPGLVALATDLDEDGHLDLFVGNDISKFQDRYYRGDGKGSFTEAARALGVAFNARLSGVYSMSAVDGDIDGDGHLDLTESSWDEEPSPIFRCANGTCRDIGDELEMFRTPRNFRWGQAIADFDDDGINELFESMGHYLISTDRPGANYPVADVPLLWSRMKHGVPFVREAPLEGLSARVAGRGVIALDLDKDGDLDVVVGAAIGTPLLLENVMKRRGHGVEVRLRGKGRNRQGIGARITVRAGGRTYPAIVHAGSSFHSSNDARTHFGIGASTTYDVEVRWPSGALTKRAGLPADQPLVVDE
jgi:hypothetical protein